MVPVVQNSFPSREQKRIESLQLLHTSADSFKVILLLPWTNCFFETQAIVVFQKSMVFVEDKKQDDKILKLILQ